MVLNKTVSYAVNEKSKTMLQVKEVQKFHYILRIAAALCLIGHGSFGIITKEIWTNYFGVFGIRHDTAYSLMPVVGCVDIILGISVLIYPIRAVLLWLAGWAFVTAMLRPLSGEPFAEFIERAGNFGAPLALLILSGTENNFKSWFTKIHPYDVRTDEKTLQRFTFCLRFVVFFLLFGHGLLNFTDKKSLIDQYHTLDFSNPYLTAKIVGITEMFFASIILFTRPWFPVVLFIFCWKVVSELFYPHYEMFEWIERAGSYGTLLCLVFLTSKTYRNAWLYKIGF